MEPELKNTEFKKTDSVHETIIDKCISHIIDKENYTTYNVIKKEIFTNGGNYLGVLHEIDIKGETTEGTKDMTFFVKSLAPDHVEMDIFSFDEIYKRENFVYLELSKIFIELEEEAKVPLEERYKMAKAYAVPQPKILFLENLARQGFKTGNRMDITTLEFAEQSLKELAKFHAFSFVLKEKRPSYFNNFIRTVKSPFIFEKPWDDTVEIFVNITLKHLSANVGNKVEEYLRSVTKRFSEYMRDENGITCLCHGDFRPNNLMFKELDGRETEVIPVDYQLMFYGCPVLDIMFFIYLSTDSEFRQKYLQHLKDHYYDSFEQFLGFFNLSADTVFPRQQFEIVFKDKMDYGLMIAIFFMPFLLSSEDNVPDLKANTVSEMNFVLDDRFKERILDVIKDFIII